MKFRYVQLFFIFSNEISPKWAKKPLVYSDSLFENRLESAFMYMLTPSKFTDYRLTCVVLYTLSILNRIKTVIKGLVVKIRIKI